MQRTTHKLLPFIVAVRRICRCMLLSDDDIYVTIKLAILGKKAYKDLPVIFAILESL